MTQQPEDRLLEAVAELARQEHVQLMSQDLGGPAFAELSEAELQMLASAVAEQLSHELPHADGAAHSVRRAAEATRSAPAPGAPGLGGRLGKWLGWLAAAAALFSGGVWLAGQALSDQEYAAQHTAASSGDRRLSLPDGSTLALSEHTEARVVTLAPHEVRVQLDRGSVECEVAHDPARRFVVATGAVEVLVKGTRFTVSSGLEATAPEHVVVSVERGLVEVREPPDRVLALLGAGQRWSSDGRNLPPVTPTAAQPPDATAPAVAPPAAAPEAALPEATVPKSAATRPAAPRSERPTVVPPARKSKPMAPAPASRTSADVAARGLFERADAERLAGRPREAAAAFDELRRRFPDDARAGYAAFMLGRIRLDSLADPSGAAEAFEFAIAHPGDGFFLEHAQARRVEALDKAGRTNECLQARTQFLARYPKAVRAPVVARLCNAR